MPATPLVKKFLAEEARPMAETLRSLRYDIESMLSQWNNGVSAEVTEGANLIDDERTSGRTRAFSRSPATSSPE